MDIFNMLDLYTPSNSDTSQEPIVELFELPEGKMIESITGTYEIFFFPEGRCQVSSDLYPDFILETGQGVFMPPNVVYRARLLSFSRCLVLRIDPFEKLYGCYSMQDLAEEPEEQEASFPGILTANKILTNLLENLSLYIHSGLNNNCLFRLKLMEMHFIFSSYYTKREMAAFFRPVLNNDFSFASFVLSNWHKVTTARELAGLSTYCETNFAKKFKQVFGISPYKWLNKKRADRIYYELINTDKPFKLIADEMNFKPLQHFNDYCLRNLGKTPGMIRKDFPLFSADQ